MSPISSDHNGHVNKITHFFTLNLHGKATIQTQGSIRTDEYTEPQPDVAILKLDEQFYANRLASILDIIILIEVAVRSLETDRTLKLKKYASVGIQRILDCYSTKKHYRNL